MLIRNYPFTPISPLPSDTPRPYLWVKIINPHKNLFITISALVDTGADICLFPSDAATVLGHNLRSGVPGMHVAGVGGEVSTFKHTLNIEVLNTLKDGFAGNKVLYRMSNVLLHFSTTNNSPFLLGSLDFLNKFILTVDYPKQQFSLWK